MKKLFFIVGIAVALSAPLPSKAWDYNTIKGRHEAINRMMKIANRAAASGDHRQMCLELDTIESVLRVFMDGFYQHFPGTDWYAYKQEVTDSMRKSGC